MTSSSPHKSASFTRFVLLALGGSALFWSPMLLRIVQFNTIAGGLLFALGGLTPCAVALLQTRGRVRAQRNPASRVSVASVTYAIALPLVAALCASVLLWLLHGSFPLWRGLSPLCSSGGSAIAFLFSTLLAGPLPEEIAWRRRALELAQTRWNTTRSSLVVGLAWWVWHIPLCLIPMSPFASAYPPGSRLFFLWGACLVVLSMHFSRRMQESNQSLTMAVLAHWAVNVTGGLTRWESTQQELFLTCLLVLGLLSLKTPSAWRFSRAAAMTLVVLSSACQSMPARVSVTPWPTSSLRASGFREELFSALDQSLSNTPEQHGMQSMLVVRRGALVFERYWNGGAADRLHDLRSATKSITALLAAIALQENRLSLETPIRDILEAYYPGKPALHGGIRVQDLLTMRSGLDCNDRDPASRGNEERMYGTQDWVAFALDLPFLSQPGLTASYCTAGVVLLGRVLESATHEPLDRFAQNRLFSPLDIQSVRWSRFDGERGIDSGGHLWMTSRDLARLGLLVLQRGAWNGQRVIDGAWIDWLTTTHTTLDGQPYGGLFWRGNLQWNNQPLELSYLSGNGGQLMFIVPALELLVIFTGENYNSPRAQLPFDILLRVVLPSLQP